MYFEQGQAPSCTLPSEWEEQVAVDPSDLQTYEQIVRSESETE